MLSIWLILNYFRANIFKKHYIFKRLVLPSWISSISDILISPYQNIYVLFAHCARINPILLHMSAVPRRCLSSALFFLVRLGRVIGDPLRVTPSLLNSKFIGEQKVVVRCIRSVYRKSGAFGISSVGSRNVASMRTMLLRIRHFFQNSYYCLFAFMFRQDLVSSKCTYVQ